MRPMRRALVYGALLLGAVGCVDGTPRTSPPPPGQGSLYVYLDPLPGSAEPLRFELGSVEAVVEDGSAWPLSLRTTAVDGSVAGQRLLAHGSLPPGRYAGLRLGFVSAATRAPETTAELRLPDEPVWIGERFSLSPRSVTVLVARLGPDAVRDGFRFTPVFSAAPPRRLPTGLLGLVSNRGSDTVTVFDKTSGVVVDVIRTGRGPTGIALDQQRLRAYVALQEDDAIEVIDLRESAVVERLRLGGGDRPEMLALTPGGTLLSANSGSDSLGLIDAEVLSERGRIAVGDRPRFVLADGDGRLAYVLNTASSTVSVVDVPGRAIVTELAVDGGPFRGRLGNDGRTLFVVHESAPYLTVVDLQALRVEDRLYLGSAATALEVDNRTGRVFVARRGTGAVDVYDPLSSLPVETLDAGGRVSSLAIDAEGNNLGVVESDRDRARIVRVVSKRTVAEIDVDDEPSWIALMGERTDAR